MGLQGRRGRGAALLTVLLVTFSTLFVCLALASLSMANLNLSSSFSTSNQALLIAQAAVAQFAQESDRFYADEGFSATGDSPRLPDWKTRFRDPVFPTGASRFPGEAHITFDPSDPYYSYDNSASSKPAAGWMDRGSSRKSVPPQSVDLIVSVAIGGTTHRYEATLRRRWPYVLCSAGQVKLMGTPPRLHDPNVPEVNALNPSIVLGPVYSVAGNATLSGVEADDEKVVPVSYDLADVIDMSKPRVDVDARVVVGMRAHARFNRNGHYYDVASPANELHGRVDVMQAISQDEALHVSVGNLQEGGVRTRVKPENMFRALQRALHTPPLPEGTELPQDRPLGVPWGRYFKLLAPGEHYVFDRTRDTRYFYYIKRDITFPPPELSASSPGQGFEYNADRQFLIRGSAGNRYFVPRIDHHGVETRSTKCGVRLDHCLLYVDGNLDLSSTEDASGNQVPVNLVGINATLIVNGNLILAGADIDAQDRGMVIYAKRLVGEARGHYRGLIMVQRAMALFPPRIPHLGDADDVQRLTVTGGIVCGGQDTRLVIADDPDWDTTPGHEGNPPSRVLQGLNLWSTTLEYDPQYLSTLHKFGPLTLMRLRRIQ
jgi:hypothetical protein